MQVLSGKEEWEWIGLTLPRSYRFHEVKDRVEKICRKLRPGMRVRNGNTHTIGVLTANPNNPKKLELGSWIFVMVTARTKAGKTIGRKTKRVWYLGHIQIPAKSRTR
ncbi:MAG: hypothetical protein UW43_C0001G0055 [Candidatus Yanofskybacteria bacterium GW2011_GWA1_44_21]|uniref:Uncharacterized protein n=2 Tax=Candidatus Yanofskyibacteriota TaxID=1752733 RepID=A0A1F8H2I6_9BACT|nr:MAG: hypothetical protein UW14_C0002G0006 [Candidatus Yanofskybacteria bacterium GW2011_GWA2_44_10]KKT50890.1 MAG: hypothetical protein UW43_C0001G0055 [Candidatus Yanofskybacteria bacterium GW2011_GWA1_44_21]KKT90462.1 MAG: hypothetical protein UW90_C0001G0050 [Candidatus Yanofskybacteria bacterium GW2011_GWB1_45_11]OGN03104.1 MAG: hypothetical protein A2657_01760 [Candidatus Yanofskybacteria bacterium RIFCSPHIGHO2_01_FULL_44_110b]OGN14269.1 MAG: hypothetical protein A3C01_01605 [Candidatus